MLQMEAESMSVPITGRQVNRRELMGPTPERDDPEDFDGIKP
jgi:hypothetical protein